MLLYGSCAQWYAHTYEQFLKISVGLGLVLVHLFRFSILCFFWFGLDYLVLVLFAFVVLALVSSVPRQEIGWEEHIWNDLICVLFCVELDTFNP